jgi:hypothetical protein
MMDIMFTLDNNTYSFTSNIYTTTVDNLSIYVMYSYGIMLFLVI